MTRPGPTLDLRDRDRDRRRVTRQRDRLTALRDGHRARTTALRTARGALGFAGTFWAVAKFKLATSLAAKLALAVLVGLGFAWPLAALALVVVVFVVAALFEGDVMNPDCDCFSARRKPRRERLDALIVARERWLADPAGPAPRILGTPSTRR